VNLLHILAYVVYQEDKKVKVVIAACMWNNPHILVMDEPTNYLDRDSLGALAGAIKKYEGGVVLISHNNRFHR